MPAPGGPETLGGVALAAEDCSPSRARLGRVAEMLREAEATPPARRRKRHDRDILAVLPPARRRPQSAVPEPRRPDDVLTAGVAGQRT